jgi:hypothetical protein
MREPTLSLSLGAIADQTDFLENRLESRHPSNPAPMPRQAKTR